MAINDAFGTESNGLANGNDLTIDGSASGTGAANITELGGSGGATVYRELDPDGDGTFEITIELESFSSGWHSQLNELTIAQSQNARIRVNNDSGNTNDYYAIGYEVDN